MTYIFVSYCSDDTAYATQLAEHLMTNGFDVWLDDRSDENINLVEKVQQSAAVLFIMTTKGGESKWVQRELAAAVQRSKPYYPLLLEGRPWILLRGAPFTDVKNAVLPSEEFLKNLVLHLPQKLVKGVNRAPQKHEALPIPNASVTTMARPEGFKELALLFAKSTQHEEKE